MKRATLAVLAMVLLISLLVFACAAPSVTKTESPNSSFAPDKSAPPSDATPSPVDSPSPAPSLSQISDNVDQSKLNNFKINLSLNAEKHSLSVEQTLTYHNNTNVKLSEIFFNLIPNAFKTDGGGIVINSISSGESTLKLKQVKGTVYKLKLPADLSPDASVKLDMNYTVNIPNIQNRFGYQGNVYNLGNFIITPAVYNSDGWAVEPYVDLGDAFYTDIANYSVGIQAPEGYVVAASGVESEKGVYIANKVRDFAFCANPTFKTLESQEGRTTIKVYYGDDLLKTAQRLMDTAKKAYTLYSGIFGEYPYETLSVTCNGLTGGVSGMEYPTLIMISPEMAIEMLDEIGVDTSSQDEMVYYLNSIDRTVAHEIAHQWFYGIVGNDQIKHPWLDEGICRYAEYLYERVYYKDVTSETFYPMEDRLKDMNTMVVGKDKQFVKNTTDMNYTLYDWSEKDPMGYGEVYDKGASLFYEMQNMMGYDNFVSALKDYVNEFAFNFVTPEKFKGFWNSKGDFSELFDFYLKKM